MANFGGRINLRGRRGDLKTQWILGGPVLTWAIICLCVAMWLVEIVLRYAAPSAFEALLSNGAMIPALAVVKPWTWLTSMFLHAPSVLHVLFNMLALLSIGPFLEKLMGHWHFLALYLISGLGGAAGLVVYCRLVGNWAMSAYGASGALFGLFAAVLVVFRRSGEDIRSMVVFMAINFAMPLITPNVAWQAHVGGFLVGLALTWLLARGVPALRRRTLTVRMLVYGAAMVVVLVAVIVLCVPSRAQLGL
ncbi:rhomboid family intramembrane serine protease [Bifidobacterium sp. ESL0763]|uniref:rhomboid family intramembrane serine protease n=1 Tax=Bifidobacterium sp. ESL0763 TaxID=2983227 RepID=UPI0023F6D111|nr:rhomboid family intramembrane serine protease [Bifidobacterium sp. ESL0763]MDF7663101.1 rhomboid family intramembrane serine protease [Bifidobacterium sp. ESL0763]